MKNIIKGLFKFITVIISTIIVSIAILLIIGKTIECIYDDSLARILIIKSGEYHSETVSYME